MDKDDFKGLDLNSNHPYIHSTHGSCGDLQIAMEYKDKIFPSLSFTGKELSKLIRSVKQRLISNGTINEEDTGKRRCDVVIRYWLSVMAVGDLVFARNKEGKVFLCEISGYISEQFFEERACFQRPVRIIKEITEGMVPEKIWKRTLGRKTVDRNAQIVVSKWVHSTFGI